MDEPMRVVQIACSESLDPKFGFLSRALYALRSDGAVFSLSEDGDWRRLDDVPGTVTSDDEVSP